MAAARPGTPTCVVPAVRNKLDVRSICAHVRALRHLRPDLLHVSCDNQWSAPYAFCRRPDENPDDRRGARSGTGVAPAPTTPRPVACARSRRVCERVEELCRRYGQLAGAFPRIGAHDLQRGEETTDLLERDWTVADFRDPAHRPRTGRSQRRAVRSRERLRRPRTRHGRAPTPGSFSSATARRGQTSNPWQSDWASPNAFTSPVGSARRGTPPFKSTSSRCRPDERASA